MFFDNSPGGGVADRLHYPANVRSSPFFYHGDEKIDNIESKGTFYRWRSKEDQLTLNDQLFKTLNKGGEKEQEVTQNNV